jgi:hypothetical protein
MPDFKGLIYNEVGVALNQKCSISNSCCTVLIQGPLLP